MFKKILKLSCLFLFISTLCFAQGLDSNTKLLFQGDLDIDSETTTDASLEVLDSTGGHVVTQNNDAVLFPNIRKMGTSSAYFDDTNDRLAVADSSQFDIFADNTASHTLEAWIYNNPDGTGFSMYHLDDATNYWYLSTTAGYIRLRCVVSDADVVYIHSDGTAISDGELHHIAMVKIEDDYGLYLDGVQVDYANDSDEGTISGATSLYIGDSGLGNSYFGGYADDIRLYSGNPYSVTVAASDPGGDWMDNTGSNNGTLTVPTVAHTSDANTHLLLPFDDDITGRVR